MDEGAKKSKKFADIISRSSLRLVRLSITVVVHTHHIFQMRTLDLPTSASRKLLGPGDRPRSMRGVAHTSLNFVPW